MRSTFLIIMIVLISEYSYACFCGGPETFVETWTDSMIHCNYEDVCAETFMVSAIKLEQIDHGMDVRILHSCGQEIADTVRVWGDIGSWCRTYTSTFDVGDTIILNMAKIDSSSFYFQIGGDQIGERVGDFELSVCGEYYLTVKNNEVRGSITPGVEKMNYSDFITIIMPHFLEGECLEVLNVDNEVFEDQISLYPNPVRTELRIESYKEIKGLIIHDSSGRTVFSESRTGIQTTTIDTKDFLPGLYFLQIHHPGKEPVVKRFYKN